MKIHHSTWNSFINKFGDYEARRRLRSYRLERQHAFLSTKRCPLALASDIVLIESTALKSRVKYKEVVRSLVSAHREHRLRIESFLLPGQPRTRLPG